MAGRQTLRVTSTHVTTSRLLPLCLPKTGSATAAVAALLRARNMAQIAALLRVETLLKRELRHV